MIEPRIKYLLGNNRDQSPSMFWEGRFDDDQKFELELKYGTVFLTVLQKEIVVGHTSDFPNVDDVILEFKNWVRNNPKTLNNLLGET